MTTLNRDLTLQQYLAWMDTLGQRGLLNQRPGSSPTGPTETSAYNPGGRGAAPVTPITEAAQDFSGQYGVDPVQQGNTEGAGGWGMFFTQLLPSIIGTAIGSGAFGNLFGSGAGATLATGLPESFAAAVPELAGNLSIAAGAPGVAPIIVSGASGGALGQALGAGAGAAAGAGAGAAFGGDNEIQITGQRPETLDVSQISKGALGDAIGSMGSGELAEPLGRPAEVGKDPGLKGGYGTLRRILEGVLTHDGVNRSGVPSSMPSAASSAAPVMSSASPFSGAGAGAGSPAGIAIKGSSAPNIYPWSEA